LAWIRQIDDGQATGYLVKLYEA